MRLRLCGQQTLTWSRAPLHTQGMIAASRLLWVLRLALLVGMGSASPAFVCPDQRNTSSYAEHGDGAGRLSHGGVCPRAAEASWFATEDSGRNAYHTHSNGDEHHHDGGDAPHEHCPCAPSGFGANLLASTGGHDFPPAGALRERLRATDDAVRLIQLSFLLLRPPSLAA